MRKPLSTALTVLALPLLGGALLTACFVEARPTDDIFGVPELTFDRCSLDGPDTCHDGDPCTRDRCVEDWARCLHEKDDSLVPDDGQGCTIDTCSDGVALHEPAPAGTPCGADGALQCDGEGACVGCGGDPLLCGQPTSCLGWACAGDTCAPEPAPAGQPLPSPDQIPNDCGVRECDGNGGVVTFRGDDPMVSPYEPCQQIDCFTGQSTLRPVGSVCNRGCEGVVSSVDAATALICDAGGSCVTSTTTACGIGYQCSDGECATECTAQTVGFDCIFPAQCIDGRCLYSKGDIPGDCQASCATFAALGCPSAPDAPSCEEACLAVSEASSPSCHDLAKMYIGCLGETAAKAATCAEHRTACQPEYKQFLECQQSDLPDGPGCSPLPCISGFDGCMCAAYCGGELFADHCVPAADGTFTCTCAKGGATVATCQGASGCGIETGCCQSAL